MWISADGMGNRAQGGPFRGVEGIFQAYDGEERAIVLISFMQKQQVVRVRFGDL